MRSVIALAVLLTALIALTGWLADADDNRARTEQDVVRCPVSSAPIDRAVFTDYRGKQVYFCCPKCRERFAENLSAYAAKANQQLAATGQAVAVACPLTGKPGSPEYPARYDGVDVNFCCPKCRGKFVRALDKTNLLFANLETGFTTQTECPVTGKPIDPTQSVEHDGKKVYFCCSKCVTVFEKDPVKYVAKLPPAASTK